MVTYQVLVDALVELPLSGAALPQLVIPVVEALPVFAEFGEAVRVDVLDAVDQIGSADVHYVHRNAHRKVAWEIPAK